LSFCESYFGADRELTEGAAFYAREGSAEVGLAFVAEFEGNGQASFPLEIPRCARG
jgi:hypothetical protein